MDSASLDVTSALVAPQAARVGPERCFASSQAQACLAHSRVPEPKEPS